MLPYYVIFFLTKAILLCNNNFTIYYIPSVYNGIKYSVFISVINQVDAQNFLFYNKFVSCLYMFRARVLVIRMSKLHYTASGIITPIDGRLSSPVGS